MPRLHSLAGIALLLAAPAALRPTTILAVRSGDRILLAADSRVSIHRGRETAASTGCKIHLTHGIAWAQTGFVFNTRSGFDLESTGTRALAATGTFDDRVQTLAAAVNEPLHRALLALYEQDRQSYYEMVETPLAIFAAGVAEDAPVLAVVEFARAESGRLSHKIYRCPGDCSSKVLYLSGGMHQEADRLVDSTPALFTRQDWTEGLRMLLDAETAENPRYVGAPYSMVEIRPSGIQWLDRGACADGSR